ncbi:MULTISPECIES: DUF1294 domain-containing protein [Enterococcus]|uniref:DUF1294 domain-containing protein n=1 Tax=Enterococcus sulfureus ATCC 49903 TaxID=1140003 RepID=S0P514_9ENTE|nr:DUF1294 domain-containing protein [Enterococcus sulfureus]EOT47676.1 hypothetical protein OMY_01050 [Enterococcus sulfureus ATCC 49903]EOT83903.1 hypothetical protein I573_01628 [Enterococcus sulfureus ATCC 49903]
MILTSYLLVLNLWLFFLMGYDKAQAKKHKFRIRERTLLLIGLFGGGLGGLVGQTVFHHKTKKPRFFVSYIFGVLVILGLYWIRKEYQ